MSTAAPPRPVPKTAEWRLYLDAFIFSRLYMPFCWGTNDCAIFAADCVLACTGKDPAPPGLRGHRTALQADRAVRRHGGLAQIATLALGEPIAVALATEGDVVLVRVGKRMALAVVNGHGGAWGPSAGGLASVPLSAARQCWRVG